APLFQRSPRDYLNDINRRLAAADGGNVQDAEVQVQTEDNGEMDAEVIVAQPEQDTGTAGDQPAPQMSREERAAAAREAYSAGREAYRAGDLQTAREEFSRAQDFGYRARLFEDSPAKYISRINDRHAADAQVSGQATAAAPGVQADP